MDNSYGNISGGIAGAGLASSVADDAYDRSESSALISADKVKGTEVYNDDDEKLGSIDSILIDKVTGEVAYVVMSFGGFLGIGEKYHPLPWHVLDYDTGIGGYRVDLDRQALAAAPSFARDEIDVYDFESDSAGVNRYYGADDDVGARSADYDDDADLQRRRDTHTDAAGNPGFYSAEQQAARNISDADTGNVPGRSTAPGAVDPSSTAGLTGSSAGTPDHWTDAQPKR